MGFHLQIIATTVSTSGLLTGQGWGLAPPMHGPGVQQMLNLASHMVLLLLMSSKPHCLGQVTKSHGMLTSRLGSCSTPGTVSPFQLNARSEISRTHICLFNSCKI